MRLSDHIVAECGKPTDIGGIFSSVAASIREAQRFELSDDVANAAYRLTRSKPTTLLSALPLVRAPYRKIWLEWRGGRTSDWLRPENKRDPLFAPDPLKQGVLIETDAKGQRGTMTFAWIHKERAERLDDPMYSPVNIAPLGTLFNWQEGAVIARDAATELARRYPTTEAKGTATALLDLILYSKYSHRLSDDQVKAWMERSAFHDWSRHAGKKHEREALSELGDHAMPWVVPHALGFFTWCADQAMQSEELLHNFLNQVVSFSWERDIEGEPPMAETVIAMMNSRNAIEHRDIDLSGLNKARIKRGRATFLPYQTTHLRLSQAQTRAFRAGLLSREQAGWHSVRGHFKIRKTGIYWWSPFFRGDPTKPAQRQEYSVTSAPD